MTDNRCSILVTTCDSYSDAWDPFFKLLTCNWSNIPYKVYLNTESLPFEYSGISIECLYPEKLQNRKGKPISWSFRLKQALEKIESPYILFFLEDFFIQSPVRDSVIKECLDFMEKNEKAVVIDFYHDPCENDDIVFSEFSEIKRDLPWAINANCTLWRKQFLLDILRDENPWDFEANATARWRRTDYKIYTHRKEYPYVFDYLFTTINGAWSGILKGKWISNVPPLFEKYGIDVNFTKRGIIDPPDLRGREREKHWFWHDVKKAFSSPKKMLHYLECTKNVTKDIIKRLWRKYFNK